MFKESKILQIITQIGIISEDMKLKRVTLGASGSEVFEISNQSKCVILKIIDLAESDHEQINMFMKEFNFYLNVKDKDINFIPQILHTECKDDYALILMKKYESVTIKEWNPKLQNDVVNLIVDVNMLPKEFIGEHAETQSLDDKVNTEFCCNEWIKLLSNYGDAFNTDIIYKIYSNLEKIENRQSNLPECLVHGDFHLNNVLRDLDDGHLILCDWQNVGKGNGTGDISFLVSRGNSDGMMLDEKEILASYCKKYSSKSSNEIQLADVLKENAIQTVLVCFKFWHLYLHDAEFERVEQIYNQMAKAYEYLIM